VPGVTGSPSSGFVNSLTQTGRFSGAANTLSLGASHVDQLLEVSSQLADLLAKSPGYVAPCMESAPRVDECLQTFFAELLLRAFRRPADEQIAGLRRFYDESAVSFGSEDALRLSVQRVLVSPDFLFRTELGDEPAGANVVPLGHYELASAVSYLISDGPPDAPLLAAAQTGKLSQQRELALHTERLLRARATGAGVENLFRETYGYSKIRGVTKDRVAFPQFTGELADAMARESEEFVAHVLWQDDGRLPTVLGAPYTVLNTLAATVYGKSAPRAGFFPVQLAKQRAGLLNHPSLMAQLATSAESSIVQRGLYMARQVLCREVPKAPPGVANAFVTINDTRPITQRQRLEQHRAEPLCGSCHDGFDPFGVALENLDGIGRFRSKLGDLPVDTAVALPELQATVANPAELATTLAASPEATECFARRLHEYTFGGESFTQPCQLDALSDVLLVNDGTVGDGVLNLVQSNTFRFRVNGKVPR
jgi:hypothetical protein